MPKVEKYIAKSVVFCYYNIKENNEKGDFGFFMIIDYSDKSFRFNHSSRTISNISFASHSHEAYEIIFMIKCNATYSVDGKEYKVRPQDLIITRPFAIHTLSIAPNSEYERFDIIFEEKIIPLSILKKIPKNINVISFRKNSNIAQLLFKTESYLTALDKEDIPQILSGLICELLLNIVLEAQNEQESIDEQTNPLVYRAVDYIEKNLLTLRGIEEISNELFITKSHLHHLFIKCMNTSPKKYITTKRLALAQREILSGCKPTEVYLRCGFTDYSSFYRSYLKYFGRTPSDKSTSNQGAKLKL